MNEVMAVLMDGTVGEVSMYPSDRAGRAQSWASADQHTSRVQSTGRLGETSPQEGL